MKPKKTNLLTLITILFHKTTSFMNVDDHFLLDEGWCPQNINESA